MSHRRVASIAWALLAALAVLASVNLATSTRRFVDAYRVYDELELALTRFDYVEPRTPVAIEMLVSNPTDQTFTVQAIDMRLNVGVHRVGGGVLYLNPPVRFQPGHTQSFPFVLYVNDRDYIQRLTTPTIDWQVTGQIQVVLGPGLDPVWIPFAVRQLPA